MLLLCDGKNLTDGTSMFPQNQIRRGLYDTYKVILNTSMVTRQKTMLSAEALKNIPSKPEGGLQSEATRMCIGLSQYIIKAIRKKLMG